MTNSTSKTFKNCEKKLIYLPHRGWVSLGGCVWKSPSSLKSSLSLADVYPDCGAFFKHKLELRDAGIVEVVQELERLNGLPEDSRELEVLKPIVILLSKCLDKAPATELWERIRPLKVFPTTPSTEISTDPKGTTYKSLEDKWYVADRTVLRRAFLGRVDILCFDVTDTDGLLPLLECAGLEDSLLSKAVKENTTHVGPIVRRHDWSRVIQNRAEFISL